LKKERRKFTAVFKKAKVEILEILEILEKLTLQEISSNYTTPQKSDSMLR
jgi:hypothetical protein